MRQRTTVLLSIFVAAMPGLCAAQQSETGPGDQNVLLINIDDLNAWVGYLGTQPNVITPNIDELADRGAAFVHAYCNAPLCNPSRSSLMLGLRPSTTGIYHNGHDWRFAFRELVSLPQHFMANGYLVAATGIKHFHGADPVSWENSFHCSLLPEPDKVPAHGVEELSTLDWAPLDIADEDIGDTVTAQWAAEFLMQDHERPFFLSVGVFRPHIPWYVPADYFDLYPLEDIILPTVNDNDLDDVPPIGLQMAETDRYHPQILKHGLWANAVQAYLASISYADAQVGRVLEALDQSPHADNTIIVLWSDHGFHLGEKLHWLKRTLWEEGLRVPFIIVAPGVTTEGARCSRPVTLLDLYPTLIDLCGLPAKAELEGNSLVPLLLDPDMVWAFPAVSTYLKGNHAVRSERWRYIRYSDGGEELYDHDNDPLEWNNLAELPEYEAVKTELAVWLPETDAVSPPGTPEILFVNSKASGANTGENWTDALVNLQDALTISNASDPHWENVQEIWVASGTYAPAPPNGDREQSFRFWDDVDIYGGFSGNETQRNQRDPLANLTILTGDLNGDDGADYLNYDENVYHVVLADGNSDSAAIDGFVITGGSADGPGMHGDGAGVYLNHSRLALRNCLVIGNRAARGGGVYISGGNNPSSRPAMINCLVRDNMAGVTGGGVYIDDVSSLWPNCLYAAEGTARPKFYNCTIVENTAPTGGGIAGTNRARPALFNCILWSNTDNTGATETAQLSGGLLGVNYSCLQGWSGRLGGIGNIGSNPLFVDPVARDYRLASGSPCIDAGDSTSVPVDADDLDGNGNAQEAVSLDLRGGVRFVDDPLTVDTGMAVPGACSNVVDMGGYEHQVDGNAYIIGAMSILVHQTEPPQDFAIDLLASNGIESRFGGPSRIAFVLTQDVNEATAVPENVQISCSLQEAPSIASVSVQDGNTLIVNLAQAPANTDCCSFCFNGIETHAGGTLDDSFNVTRLEGDLNFNGIVTGGDPTLVKTHFGEIVGIDAPSPHWDFDRTGGVTGSDFALIKPLLGRVAETCP